MTRFCILPVLTLKISFTEFDRRIAELYANGDVEVFITISDEAERAEEE